MEKREKWKNEQKLRKLLKDVFRQVMLFTHPTFYTLLFHSLFKVKFDIDHFVLGEHRER